MLCRALLAVTILSYVLCVLLLSGVQKEDLDEGTLRKLQRHNVNIDDINDPKLQDHCLGKTNAPITLTTLQASPATEKTVTEKTTAKQTPIETDNVASLSADTTPLQKIVEYLQNIHKEERKALETKESKHEVNPITTLPTSNSIPYAQRTKMEDLNTNKPQMTVTDVEKNNKSDMNKELENLMKIWQTNIGRASDTTPQESTTIKIIKDDAVSKTTKDVEYISKIVAEVLSQTKIDKINTSTTSPEHNLNKTFRDADQIFTHPSQNKSILPKNYFLNNCKLGNFYEKKQGENSDIFENFYKRLNYGINVPATDTRTDDDYVICKRVQSKDKETLLTDRADYNTISHILTKLKKGSQGFNVLDNESAKAFDSSLENQPKTLLFNRQRDDFKSTNKERLNTLDNESAKALETVLENQAKNIIFNRQNDPINNNKGLSLMDNENANNVFETTVFDQQGHRVETTKEKQDYARLFEENKKLWAKYFGSLQNTEPKLENEQSETTNKPPDMRYKTSKQDEQVTDEEYKKWLFTFHNPLKKQESTMETNKNHLLNSRVVNPDKSTDIHNIIQYNPNIYSQYKQPWFYGRLGSQEFGTNIKGKQDRVLFKLNSHEKITNTIDPRLRNTYRKKPPYFEPVSNISFVPTQEREITKNNRESILVDSDNSQLTQPNYWERSRESNDISKTYPKFVGWYQKKTPFTTENRSPKQFEPTEDTKIIRVGSQTALQNKIDPIPDSSFKSNYAYFRNKLSKKQHPKMEEHNEETEYFINRKSTKRNNYYYPPRPYEENAKNPLIDMNTSKNQYVKYTSKEKLSNESQKKNNINLPTFPLNVIKDIANSVKDIVLRDLKTTITIPTTTILTTTTPLTSTRTTTTTIPTTTTSTTITTTPTTITEGTVTTTTKADPLKVQDASKALEKIMEIFEKINSMKDKMVRLDNVKNSDSVHYNTSATATQHIKQKPVKFKSKNHKPYDVQPMQLGSGNGVPYDPQTSQRKPENLVPYYSMKSPYYRPKIKYDPYVVKSLEFVTEKIKPKEAPRPHNAITVQTNSGEIAPLKIAVQKPIIQNIVLTTKKPIKEETSVEIHNYRKPIHSEQVHHNKKDEVDHNRVNKQSFPRHSHKDAYLDKPKSRKIKMEHDFTENYKSRDLQAIESFHEKLEGGDHWSPHEQEKIAQRMQRPLVKEPNYDDTHFRNFLKTQQKVNAMLEKILGSGKARPTSAEII